MRVHDPEDCKGQHCPIHNPSDHHMRDWPTTIRASGLVERVCKHGCGHPDPDSLAYLERVAPDGVWGVHGCCGCCHAETVDA